MFGKNQKFLIGFTLIELLIVMAIIGLLASVVLVTSNKAVGQARDSRRIQDVYAIAYALEMYYAEYEEYPNNTDSGDIGCWGNWDAGNSLNGESDSFIQSLMDEGYLAIIPIEKRTTGNSDWEKCSYRYQKVEDPCGGCVGTYAVLYAVCETNLCPTNERPSCCTDDFEGAPTWDKRDIAIFLKQR